MMTTTDDDKMLDSAFAEMRGDITPSEDLMNRIMFDADMVLAETAPPAVAVPQSLGAALRDLIGGWPQFAGLATATVAGLLIGVAQPASLTDLSASLWGGTIEVPLLESDLFAGLEG
jgi:hypothetical protein